MESQMWQLAAVTTEVRNGKKAENTLAPEYSTELVLNFGL